MKLKYNTIKLNDVANGPGICVSIYLQGCDHHCKGCFNPETWDFKGGQDFTEETMDYILNNMRANGIKRDLCILGGEPLHVASKNLALTFGIILKVKNKYPDTKIYIWTGYKYEDIKKHPHIQYVLDEADYLIDGPFIEEQKDLTLKMRGSKNQRIIDLKNLTFIE